MTRAFGGEVLKCHEPIARRIANKSGVHRAALSIPRTIPRARGILLMASAGPAVAGRTIAVAPGPVARLRSGTVKKVV